MAPRVCKPTQNQSAGRFADPVEILRHRRQAQIFQAGRDDIIEADQRNIFRNAQAQAAQSRRRSGAPRNRPAGT